MGDFGAVSVSGLWAMRAASACSEQVIKTSTPRQIEHFHIVHMRSGVVPRTVRTDAAFSEQRRLIGICAFVLVERLVHGMLGAR